MKTWTNVNGNTHTRPWRTTDTEQARGRPGDSSITFELKYPECRHFELTMDLAPPDWLVELRHMRGRVLYDEQLRPSFRRPDGSFDDPDPADLSAYHIIARAGRCIVGCARIVSSENIQSGFIASTLGMQQLQKIFDIVGTHRQEVCEASRWVVVPEFRGELGRRIVAASLAVGRWLSIRIAFALAATCRKQDLALIRMGARPVNGLPLFATPISYDKCCLLYFDLMHPSPGMGKQISEMTEALGLGHLICPSESCPATIVRTEDF